VAAGWNAVTGLSAGTLTVNAAGAATQTPVASDYTIGKLGQTAGSVTAVTITAKSEKSPGAISNIKYNNSTTIPQTVGTYAVTFDVDAAPNWNMATGLSAGNLTVNAVGNTTQTPVKDDYTFGNLTQTANSVTAATITAGTGKSPGAITISYTGVAPTTYPKSTTIPQTAGTYAVTFDVAVAAGWNAVTGLSAGTLTVNAAGAATQTPVASDYNFSNLIQTANSVTAVTITAGTGKSPGSITISYTGVAPTTYPKSITIPQAAGTYTVTFDVAAAPGWNPATALPAGNLVVNPVGVVPQTPVPSDFTFGNLTQTAGNVTAVTITANPGKSTGAVSNIKYSNSATIPQAAGSYAVTFDVAAASGWNPATGLSAGTLTVNAVVVGNQTPVANDFTFGNLAQTVDSVTAVTITAKPGKSTGAVSNIKYDNSDMIPQAAGVYAVTFDVEAAAGWNAATGLSAGNLIVAYPFAIIETDDAVTIGDYSGTSTDVVIPAEINGKPVTTIKEKAFINKNLTGVTIPNGVTTIGDRAFQSNQLTSVDIPDSVTTIGDYAFMVNQLTSVDIPNSVSTLGMGAFYDNKLISVDIPDSVTTIGDYAFMVNRLTSIDIPDSITTIGDYAFAVNPLTSVSIPDGVTTIGENAFRENRLISVSIPNSVTTIGDYAFYDNKLTSVTISDNVTIGEDAFGDNLLTSITIGTNVTLDASSFPTGFNTAYEDEDEGGEGTYTRPNITSDVWTKEP
jgi:hypothetical protein